MSNRPPLKLHVPVPRVRPGDHPDFSHIAIEAAGATRRPDVLAAEATMRDMPYGLVRVLDDDGQATGPWDPQLEPETLRRGLRAMVLTRAFDDTHVPVAPSGQDRLLHELDRRGGDRCRTSMVLDRDDMCFPTYRMVS